VGEGAAPRFLSATALFVRHALQSCVGFSPMIVSGTVSSGLASLYAWKGQGAWVGCELVCPVQSSSEVRDYASIKEEPMRAATLS